MRSIKSLVICASLGFMLNGCYTIYFHEDSGKETTITKTHWHHGGGIFGLFEFSEPRIYNNECPKGSWKVVRHRQSFLTGLVSAIVPYGIFTPQEFGISCKKGS